MNAIQSARTRLDRTVAIKVLPERVASDLDLKSGSSARRNHSKERWRWLHAVNRGES